MFFLSEKTSDEGWCLFTWLPTVSSFHPEPMKIFRKIWVRWKSANSFQERKVDLEIYQLNLEQLSCVWMNVYFEESPKLGQYEAPKNFQTATPHPLSCTCECVFNSLVHMWLRFNKSRTGTVRSHFKKSTKGQQRATPTPPPPTPRRGGGVQTENRKYQNYKCKK